MDRRNFLKTSSLGSLGTIAIAKGIDMNSAASPLKIGICADIHLDTVFDGKQRLENFISAMRTEKPDLIVQLGDFCGPKEGNNALLDSWNRFEGPTCHVIGNHDTDGDFTKQQVVDFWKIPNAYYSFDLKGYHFMILDGNDPYANKDPRNKYWSYIGQEQQDWMEAELEKTDLPVIVFMHQGLDNDMGGVENAVQVRAIFDRHNKKKKNKVQVVFSGHHHEDYYNVINGVHYVQVNSMSYKWLGKGYEHVPYTEEINKKFWLTKWTAPYRDPLWAVVEISNGMLQMKGKASAFVGKTPKELGRPPYPAGYPEVPFISDRKINLA